MVFRFKPTFVRVSEVADVVPYSGLSMREIYNRYVKTGAVTVPVNSSGVPSSEDNPVSLDGDYQPSIPVIDPVLDPVQEIQNTQESEN